MKSESPIMDFPYISTSCYVKHLKAGEMLLTCDVLQILIRVYDQNLSQLLAFCNHNS